MKLTINYDFFDAILNVNEDINAFKVIRNNKKKLALLTPSCMAFSYFVLRKVPEALLTTLLMDLYSIFKMTFEEELTGIDVYKNKSSRDLIKLVSLLKEYLYLNTDMDLLKQSSLDYKDYSINLNKEELVSIIESKYILVPVYDFNGNVKNSSILQEHSIGSCNYVLSVGSPKKILKPALVGI